MDKMIKVFESEIRGIDEKESTLTALISTNTIDRMEEVLEPAGVDLKNFNRNPVVMWAHDYSQPPIGKALWTKREGDTGIISKVKFAPTPFAQEIFQLYKEGYLKAFSVGFLPKEVADEEAKCNDGKKPRRKYLKWELLEYSAVPIPANPEALALAMQNGILKDDAIIKSMEKGLTPEPIIAATTPELIVSTSTKTMDDLLAEIDLLHKQSEQLNQECMELRYKLYQITESIKTAKVDATPEITAESLATKIVATVDGVIRKAQGKVS